MQPENDDLSSRIERSPTATGFTGVYARGRRFVARWMHDELGRFSTAELAAIVRYWFEQGRRSVARDSLVATGTPRGEAERLSRYHGSGEPLVIPEAGVGPMSTLVEANQPRRGRPPKALAAADPGPDPTPEVVRCRHPAEHRGQPAGLPRGRSVCLVCNALLISGSEIMAVWATVSGEPEELSSRAVVTDDISTSHGVGGGAARGELPTAEPPGVAAQPAEQNRAVGVENKGGSSDTTYDEPPRAAEPDGGKAPATLPTILPWAYNLRQAAHPDDDGEGDPEP